MTKTKKRFFTKKDYNANDGFLTKIWGPSIWHFLHTMSFNFPVEPTLKEKQYYRNYILSLVHVLPCKHCRINLKKNFKHMPLDMKHMQNRETFSKYVYLLHEDVNTMLNKKSGLTYSDVRERYEHFRSRCTDQLSETTSKSGMKTLKIKTHKGCIQPLHGKKMKCILKFVPESDKCEMFQMDKRVQCPIEKK